MTGAPFILGVLLGLAALTSATKCPKQKQSPGREVVCYTSTNDLDQLTDTVCRCTTLVHQGHDLRNITSSDVKNLRKTLKDIYPALQVVVSVADPTGSLKTSATMRQDTSARLANILKEVDGVELNVTAGSKERLFHFVKGLKDEMVRKSTDKRIFLALPTKSAEIAKQFDLKELSKYVDLFTISTDYLVDDDEVYHTFHPSRLIGLFDMLNTDSLVDLISGLGAPKRKILVSLPASGYKFTLTNEEENAPRSPTKEREPAVINRKELCDSMSNGEWTVERDEDLTAPYAFKEKTWIAFEDNISTGIKGKYVMVRDLAGIGVKNVENDLQTDCGKPLAHEVHHAFTNFKRKSREAVLSSLEDDLHQSQIAYSNHIKSSDFRIVRVVDTEGHIRAVRESTQTEFSCPRQGYFVHPKSCNRFYRCVKFNQGVENYSVFEFDCPAGLSFDERTEVCVWPHTLPEGSPCPGSSEIAPVARMRFECPDQPGYYADPQNGRWFFACIDLGQPKLMAYEFRCPYGLVFDQERLVCEWPWNVEGYETSEYTKTQYGGGGHTSAGIAYTTKSGISYTGGGHSGPAGVAYGSTKAQSAGAGYSGGAGGAQIGTVASGYSGGAGGAHVDSTGSGYSVGVGGSHIGSTGSGYSVGAGASQIGSTVSGYSVDASASHIGTTGSGYSGGSGGAHIGSTGSGYSRGSSGAHVGTAGSGYSGGVGGAHIGSTGSGYSGGVGGAHVGTGGSGYSGGATDGHIGTTGSGYSSDAGGAHIGTTGSGYSGGAGGTHIGTTGSGYSGGAAQGHIGTTGSGYSGGAGGAHIGTTGSGYSGGAGGAHIGTTGSGYSGGAGGAQAHIGSTGSGYSGDAHGSHVSTVETGYSGGGGSIQFGTTISGHSIGAGGVGLSNIGTDHSGSVGGAHVGTTGSGYSGASGNVYTSAEHAGTTGSVYSGSVYSGSSGSVYTSGTQQGSIGSGYTGSSGSIYTSDGHSGSSGYAGSSSTAYGGSVSGQEASSSASGYAGSSAGGSFGTKYTGSTVGISTGEFSGYDGKQQISGVSSGSVGLPTGGYTSQTVSAGIGVSKSGYSTASAHSGDGIKSSTGSGYTVPIGSEKPSVPIYASSRPTGTGFPITGISSGSGSVTVSGKTETTGYGKVPPLNRQNGITVDNQVPSVSYIPSSPEIGHSTSKTSLSSERFGSSGYTIDHGQSVGTTYVSGTNAVNGGHGGSVYSGGVATRPTYQGVGLTRGYGREQAGQEGLNITFVSGLPTGPSYHGGLDQSGFGGVGPTGGILTGNSVQGAIITGDSSSGTLITTSSSGGTVFSGSVDQGAIITGTGRPGYVQTESGTPGYVVDGGSKTIYTGSASPGTVLYGSASPGVNIQGVSQPGLTLKGSLSPGIVLTGSVAPGVTLGGSVQPGSVAGGSTGTSTSSHRGSSGTLGGGFTSYRGTTKIGSVPVTPAPSTGYQTNEYHDNGGRGTIRFNNGYVTSKYTENDLPDYRPSIGVIPETIAPVGRPEESAGAVLGTTASGSRTQTERTNIQGGSSFTPSGFTKTGPTKTGYTTATLGGSGSYVISTGPKPTFNPDNIGEKAFTGNIGQAGFSRTTTTFSSTQAPSYGRVDSSRVTQGSSQSTGYTYPKPKIPFETGVSSVPTAASPSSNGIFIGTTPTPILNVEVYNKPTTVQTGYRGSTSSRFPTGFSKTAPQVSSTASPISYVTGPLETYKTTVFEAAKLPVSISTVHPIIDNGYKTMVSPSAIPVTLGGESFTYKDGSYRTGSINQVQTTLNAGATLQGIGIDHDDIPVTTYRPSILSGSGRPYGPSVSVSTYDQPRVTLKSEVQYLPTSTARPIGSTISPAVGVTYKRPYSTSDVTYQSTARPTVVTVSSKGFSGSYDTSDVSYTEQGYAGQSHSTHGLGTAISGGSPTNVGISRDEVEKLVTNYQGTSRGTVKYTPSSYDTYTGSDQTKSTGAISGFSSGKTSSSFDSSSFGQFETTASGFGKTQTSNTAISQYGGRGSTVIQKSPVGSTYTGVYGGISGGVSSVTPSYEVTTKSIIGEGKGKVIVKWSDLHPLLLGKLGAECTCKSDPFANIRGPGKKLIESNRGKVDLANYDESDVYVDLENEGSDYDYETNDRSAGSPLRIGSGQASTLPLIAGATGKGYTDRVPFSTYLPRGSSTVAPATSVKSNLAFSSGQRSGKSFIGGVSPANLIGGQGASFDRYGPGGYRDSDEVLEGVSDCARPGLFRHPNFCNKFYACHWDEWKKKFTLHVFNCPVHLTFDNGAGACNWPSKGPACQDDNLLV